MGPTAELLDLLRNYEGCGEYIRQVRNPLSRTPDRLSSRSGNRTSRHHHNVDRAISSSGAFSVFYFRPLWKLEGGHEGGTYTTSMRSSTFRRPFGLSAVDVHSVVRAVGSGLSSAFALLPSSSLFLFSFSFSLYPGAAVERNDDSMHQSLVISGP